MELASAMEVAIYIHKGSGSSDPSSMSGTIINSEVFVCGTPFFFVLGGMEDSSSGTDSLKKTENVPSMNVLFQQMAPPGCSSKLLAPAQIT